MWQCEIRHDGLHKYRVVKGATREIMQLRAEMQMRTWNEQWERVQAARSKRQEHVKAAYTKETNKQLAANRTIEAQQALDVLEHLLFGILEEDYTIDWDQLKNRSPYPIGAPAKHPGELVPKEPDVADLSFAALLNFLTRLIPPIRDKELARARARFSEARKLWLNAKEQVELRNKEFAKQYAESCSLHEAAKVEWMEERDKRNVAIDEWREAYMDRKPESSAEYCKTVLSNSRYPDTFPCDSLVDYIEDTRTLVVDYSLPDPPALPTLKEVKYVAAREAFQEVHVTEAWLNRTYDLVLYQIALRSLYELFQADAANGVDSIVFNGWVNSIDKATGKEVTACVLSVQASKSEFMDINLAQVDPKACFRKLKGVSAAKLTALQPVRPLLLLNRDDRRFVPAYNVAETLDGSSNLAAMDWEDFEHLIRQLFEEEFSAGGGEVKITQASRQRRRKPRAPDSANNTKERAKVAATASLLWLRTKAHISAIPLWFGVSGTPLYN